jgi:uncharacterized repeat protein (TIGR02543 family)
MTPVRLALLVVLAALVVGAGGAVSYAATPPPTLTVEVIGKGRVTGTGISCGAAAVICHAAYGADGTPVTLTATPLAGSGWTFDHWEDDGSGCGSTTPCALGALSGDHVVTAVFKTSAAVGTSTFGVTLTESGTPATAGGAVVDNNSSSVPIDCDPDAGTTTCSATVLTGSTITVLAQPESGYFFNTWGGSCAGSSVSCSVYVTGNRTVSADFVAGETHTLTLHVAGAGTVSGGGVTCSAGSTCTIAEPSTTTLQLTASPQSGYAFTGWGNDCSGDQPTCTVQMTDDHEVTANFDQLVPVLVTVSGLGTVSGGGVTCGPGPQTCSVGVAPSSTVQFTASPTTTGGSITWSGCSSSGGNVCTVNVNSTSIAVTATFSGGGGGGGGSQFLLSTSVTGDGYLTASLGSASIYCTPAGGTGCSANVTQNTYVTITAVSATGAASAFNGWGGACATSTTLTCTIQMNGAKSVSADFDGPGDTFNITASTTGSGSLSGAGISCRGSGTGCVAPQAANATVTVTARPDPGASFTGWGGACSGTATTCTLTMTQAYTLTAAFASAERGSQTLTVAVTGAGKVKVGTDTCVSTEAKPGTCSEQVATGSSVTLTATPATGYTFGGWKGACSGSKDTCTVTVSAAAAVEVTFIAPGLQPAKKPRVVKAGKGLTVTLYYTAHEAGKLTLVATRAGKKALTLHKAAKKGAGSMVAKLTRPGTYVVTITLSAKSGKSSVQWTVKR